MGVVNVACTQSGAFATMFLKSQPAPSLTTVLQLYDISFSRQNPIRASHPSITLSWVVDTSLVSLSYAIRGAHESQQPDTVSSKTSGSLQQACLIRVQQNQRTRGFDAAATKSRRRKEGLITGQPACSLSRRPPIGLITENYWPPSIDWQTRQFLGDTLHNTSG